MNLIKKYPTFFKIAFFLSVIIKPALFFLLFGSLILYITITHSIFLKKVKQDGIGCTGTLVDYREDSEGTDIPIIEFTTKAGELITGEPSGRSSSDLSINPKKSLYQQVDILYDVSNPKKFILNDNRDFDHLFFAFLLLIGLGAIVLFFSNMLGYIKLG